jgi:tRNA threonylcarbamoyladenosine biosynthesis protein TsaB
LLILAVDTSTFAGSVALLRERRLLAEINLVSSQTHSERLLASIDLLLKSLTLKLEDLDGFALAVGPGSFTGIRIGMSTVKSFALAHGKPVAPVSNLGALAQKLRQSPARLLCPVMDAKKQEIYGALFEKGSEGLQEVLPQGVYTPDRFFSQLPSHRIITFIGSGVPVYKQKIFQYFKDKARLSQRSLFVAYEVGLLGHEMFKAGKGVDSFQVEPQYIRRSQAEEGHR